MIISQNYSLINEKIFESSNILITTHINPDGDAIGSALSLKRYCNSISKNAEIVNISPTPNYLEFLLNNNDSKDEIIVFDESNFDIQKYDLVIISDLNTYKRLGKLGEIIKDSKIYKIVIDHHLEPVEFADFYLMDYTASSASELIYYLVKNNPNSQLTKSIAEAIYCGIMTDTGSFRFDRTDAELHRVTAELLETGVNPTYIYDKINNSKSIQAINLQGRSLSNMKLYLEGKFAIIQIQKEDFELSGSNEDDIESLSQLLLIVEGVKIGLLMTSIEERNEIRLSFRSKDEISCREIAVKYGGGGHKYAAGARISNRKFEDVKSEILDEVQKILN